ncbi:hypothetical protein D7M15_12990 [Streptomyces sp. Z26]|nr:hypothetical protein D7M15_12990 [Streptomyces sp. Z26]
MGPAAATAAAILLVGGCTGQSDDSKSPSGSGSSAATPHGYVEGASEAAEQQSRLLLGDPAGGETRVLDLITGKVHHTDRRPDASALTTDGRFGYFHTPDGVHVLDSGAWMVDHGDHVHYYRAKIRQVGEMPDGRRVTIRSDAGVTVATGADGRADVYRRADLEEARLGSPVELPGGYAGAVVPYAEHLIALTGGDDAPAELAVLDRSGKAVDTPKATCRDPRGDAVTRRGAVLGCADGALLIHEQDGELTARKIPYGEDVPAAERARAFRLRPGSSTLTATAGARAVWVLDVTESRWTRIRTGPVVTANTAGEGTPLVVLETDGALHGYDIATGKETGATPRLLKNPPRTVAGEGPAPVIEVDRSRAYLNDPEGKRVHEIDYNDDLRVARTFALDIRPALMVETGR